MITRNESYCQDEDWKLSLKKATTSIEVLCERLNIRIDDLMLRHQASRSFPLRVTESYLNRIQKGTLTDPLLLQILPQAAELIEVKGFVESPLAEESFTVLPGLIRKYKSRVLLTTTGFCPINCRYCFRRNFDYEQNQRNSNDWQPVFDYLHRHPEINEVILSGGDPLSLTDRALAKLLGGLSDIPNINTVRFHSRIPVILPNRITRSLLKLLSTSKMTTLMVLHINHLNELNNEVKSYLNLLQSHGIRLFNQSVLLKGVNDSLEDQVNLLTTLFAWDIKAYYLHLLDKVKGAQHFYCSDESAIALFDAMRAALPGYMLPKLVRETPHDIAKTPVYR